MKKRTEAAEQIETPDLKIKTAFPFESLSSALQEGTTSALVGKGFSGSIRSCRIPITPNGNPIPVAFKTLPLKESKRLFEETQREVNLFEVLPPSPYIVQYFGTCIHNETAFIVMERAGEKCCLQFSLLSDTDLLSVLKYQTEARVLHVAEELPSGIVSLLGFLTFKIFGYKCV